MSTTIDERVVSMQFDNKNFEKNVQTSMSTLDKLKQSLKLTDSAKGLENVDNVSKKIDFSVLLDAIENAKYKFSVLRVMAISALDDITKSALATAKRVASAFTIDPIKTGLQEYETQINAVQTILANTSSKGTTLEEVNNALDELNKYADLTIYNFTEMTRNIGTFTAAGLDLKTSTSAIQGIANLAAVSGSTSQQASTAMYQLSQALSSGTVKLQDWNSVVNASMGGQVFQDALKETSRQCVKVAENVRNMSAEEKKAYQEQHNYTDDQMKAVQEYGFNVDQIIEKQGSFRESLQEGWITSDVLARTLNKFTKSGVVDYISEMSGASTEAVKKFQDLAEKTGYDTKEVEKLAKELANGDDELAKVILDTAKMANTAEDAATKVKTFSQLMDTLKEAAQSGWTQTWEILIGDFEEAKKLWTSVSDTVSEMLNESAELRNNMLQGWKDAGGREMALEALSNAFKALMSVITPVKEAFRKVFPRMTSEQLLKITEAIKNLTAKLILSEEQTTKLKETFVGIFSVIKIVVNFLKQLAAAAVKIIGNLSGFGDSVLDITSAIGEWLTGLSEWISKNDIFATAIEKITDILQKAIDKVKEFTKLITSKISFPSFEGFITVLSAIWSFIKKIGSKIGEVFSGLGEGLADAFHAGDLSAGLDIINGGILTTILVGVKKFVSGIGDSIENVGGVVENVKDILNGVKGTLEAWQQSLKSKVLLNIAIAIGILALSLIALSTIDQEKLSSSLGAITVMFGDLIGSLALFGKMNTGFTGATKAATLMISMSISLLILAGAMKKLSGISWEGIAKGMSSIIVLMYVMSKCVESIATSFSEGKGYKGLVKAGIGMIAMAAALKILASVCKDLSQLSWEGIAKGISGVVVMMFVMTECMEKLSGSKGLVKAGIGMIAMAAALKILASVCKDLSQLSWEGIVKGLSATVIMMYALSASMEKLSGSKRLVKAGIGMIAMAAALKILASVCKDMSSLKWEELAKGISGLVIMLFMLTVCAKALSGSKGLVKAGVGMIAMSAAIKILASALLTMGGMSWEEIGKGLTVLTVSLIEMTVALNLMKGTLGGSAALIIAAGALAILTPVLVTLGKMSWESIAKGLITIAGAFTIIGLAGLILKPLLPTILGLAVSMALVGVAIAGIGVGLLAVSAAFTALAVAGTAGATAIVAALSIIITGIIALIPAIAEKIGEAIIVFCNVIAEGVPAIGAAIKAVILTALEVIGECVPEIVKTVLAVLDSVLSSLSGHMPSIIDNVMSILISIIDGIATRLPELIQAAVNLFMQFFSGIVEALKGIDTTALVEGIIGVGLIAGLMAALSAVAGLAPGAMVGVLAIGAVIAELALVIAAIGALAQIPGLEWLISEGGDFLQVVGTAIGKFIGGIIGGVAEGVTSTLPAVGDNLSAFMTNAKPFIDGAKNIKPSMLEGVKSIAEMILVLTAANLIDSIASFLGGESSLEKFGADLIPFGNAMVAFSQIISGNIDEGAVTAAANAGKTLAEMADTIPNSGGVVGFFAGENDLDAFTEMLVPFGQAMVNFSQTVSGNIDSEAVTAAANAGKMMAEMADTIPNSGGVVGFFAGENDMDTFGEQIESFGEHIAAFSEHVNGKIDETAVTAAANAGKMMAEMADTIPNSGGVVGFFTGDNDMDDFGEQIESFGESMVEFSKTVSGNIDESAVSAASNAGMAMAQLNNSIPNSGGIKSWFTGDKSMEDFSDNVVSFGKAMAKFSKEVSGKVDVESFKSVSSSMGYLSTSISRANSVDTSNIESFVNTLKTFSEIGSIKIDADSVSQTASSANTAVNKMMNSMNSSITGSQSSISSSMSTAMSGTSKAISESSSANVTAIKNVLDNIIKAIKDSRGNVELAFRYLMTAGQETIKNQRENFKTSGKFVIQGLIDGLESKRQDIVKKVKSLAKTANDTFTKAENINSPSKVWYSYGGYMVKGLTNALDNGVSSVVNSTKNIANKSKTTMSKAISKISDSINSDMSTQPTIRPVLDLSNITSGAGKINDIFGMSPSVGLLTNVGTIGGMINSQNGSKFGMLDEIKGLRSDLANSENGVNLTVNLDYNANSDANTIANDIATSLRRAVRRGV